MNNLLADQLYTIYIAVLYFSIVVAIALIGYLWSRRSIKAVLPIIGILISILFWSVGYLLEYTTTDLSTKLFTYNIQYLGIASIPVMFLMFTLKYTRRDNWMNLRRLLLISIIPIITIIIVWTKKGDDSGNQTTICRATQSHGQDLDQDQGGKDSRSLHS